MYLKHFCYFIKCVKLQNIHPFLFILNYIAQHYATIKTKIIGKRFSLYPSKDILYIVFLVFPATTQDIEKNKKSGESP
jgi:hypothetical protein